MRLNELSQANSILTKFGLDPSHKDEIGSAETVDSSLYSDTPEAAKWWDELYKQYNIPDGQTDEINRQVSDAAKKAVNRGEEATLAKKAGQGDQTADKQYQAARSANNVTAAASAMKVLDKAKTQSDVQGTNPPDQLHK